MRRCSRWSFQPNLIFARTAGHYDGEENYHGENDDVPHTALAILLVLKKTHKTLADDHLRVQSFGLCRNRQIFGPLA